MHLIRTLKMLTKCAWENEKKTFVCVCCNNHFCQLSISVSFSLCLCYVVRFMSFLKHWKSLQFPDLYWILKEFSFFSNFISFYFYIVRLHAVIVYSVYVSSVLYVFLSLSLARFLSITCVCLCIVILIMIVMQTNIPPTPNTRPQP